MHIYCLQKIMSSLVFISNLYITNLKNTKQLHYTLCKIQVCSLDRISEYCPHLLVLKFVCAVTPSVLLAAAHFTFVRTRAIINTYTGFTEIPFLHSVRRCGCFCRKAVYTFFQCSSQVLSVLAEERKQLNVLFLHSEFSF